MNKLPERIRIKDIARLANVSVGTVDRVIHGRVGVSEESKKRVNEILEQLDYHPNMYASALATNKKYQFVCLLPNHEDGEYWAAVENGIAHALNNFSDFHISVKTLYYDPYDYNSFLSMSQEIASMDPDGVIVAPTIAQHTQKLADTLKSKDIPYIYIDSNLRDIPALSFFGQNSEQSGYFAGRMLMLLEGNHSEVAIFRKINEGIVGSNQQENREIGFRKYMSKHYPQCRIIEVNLHAKRPEEDNEILDAFFEAHPEVSNGITFNSKVYTVGEYFKAQHKKPINLIGYDLLERNIACLKDRTVTFLIAQQPELQGFNGIKTLCDHLIFKKEVTPVNYMPIDLITAETIDYYLKLYL